MFATATQTVSRAVIGAVGTLLMAGVCLAGAAAPAHAEEAVRTQKVYYGDLDLGTAQGQKKLNWRIRSAARAVCDQPGNEARAQLEEAHCIVNAIEATRNQTMAAITANRVG